MTLQISCHPYLVSEDLPPLTHRQERRVVKRIISANSFESWDFPPTPLASTHRRHLSEDYFTTNEKENLNTSFLSPEACEQAKRGNNLSSSSGTSNSSIVLNSTTRSISPPSSYSESMDPSCGVQEKPSSESRPGLEHTAVSSEPSLPALSPRSPSPQFIASSTLTPTTLTNQQGLWRKIKNNVRPSSSGNDVERLSISPRKERGKFGSIFASASKSLLSSRSHANGTPAVFDFPQRRCLDLYFSSCRRREINISLYDIIAHIMHLYLISFSTVTHHMVFILLFYAQVKEIEFIVTLRSLITIQFTS